LASFVRSAFLIALVPPLLGAQQSRRVSGVIERTTEDTTAPLAGAWVVLHRVGRGSAGPLDSMRSDARGRYAFQYRTTADSAVYFASSMHNGVAYFTPPFAGVNVTGDEAEIVVFDTSSAGAGPQSRGRHIVVFSSTDKTVRRVSEVLWLENTSAATRVASRSGPAWRGQIPAVASVPRIDGGNFPPDAVRFAAGVVELYAPISPGLHQIHFSYDVPVKAFPLAMLVGDSTTVLEVLLEDQTGSVRHAAFATEDPVTVEGRTFRRFLAHDMPPGATVQIVIPATSRISGRTLYIMAVIAAAGFVLLLGLMRGQGRRAPLPSVTKDTPLQADQLASAIATLDEQFAKQKAPGDAAREAYRAKRADLNAQLTAVLEARDDAI
jgi:hypothetical protein